MRVVTRGIGLTGGRRMVSRMDEVTGHDNYLGELAALIDAFDHMAPGGRVGIMFDATSPVSALLKFVNSGPRERNRFYAAS